MNNLKMGVLIVMKDRKKRLHLIVILVLILVLSMLTSCSGKLIGVSGNSEKLLVYSNSEHNIKAKYSSNWEYKEDIMGAVVAFVSPLESESDSFRENMNIVIQDLSGFEISLKEYSDISIEQLKKSITNFKLVSNQVYDQLNDKAYELVFTGIRNEFHMKWKTIFFIKDEKAYIITCTAEEDKFNDYLSYFEQFALDLEY